MAKDKKFGADHDYFEVSGRKYLKRGDLASHGKGNVNVDKINSTMKAGENWVNGQRGKVYKQNEIRSYTDEKRFGEKGAGFLSFTAHRHPDFHAPSRELSPEQFVRLVFPLYILNATIKFDKSTKKVRTFLTQTLNMMTGFFKHKIGKKGAKSLKSEFREQSKVQDISKWAETVTKHLGSMTRSVEDKVVKDKLRKQDKNGKIIWSKSWIKENLTDSMIRKLRKGKFSGFKTSGNTKTDEKTGKPLPKSKQQSIRSSEHQNKTAGNKYDKTKNVTAQSKYNKTKKTDTKTA